MTTGPCTEPARVPAPRRPRIRSIAADLTDAGSTRDEKGGIGYARLEVGDHIADIQSADGEMRDGQLSSGRAFAQKYRLMYHRHLAIFANSPTTCTRDDGRAADVRARQSVVASAPRHRAPLGVRDPAGEAAAAPGGLARPPTCTAATSRDRSTASRRLGGFVVVGAGWSRHGGVDPTAVGCAVEPPEHKALRLRGVFGLSRPYRLSPQTFKGRGDRGQNRNSRDTASDSARPLSTADTR